MNTHIPTIEDLNRKTARELRVMFRNAASIAASDLHPAPERAAARQTLENIRLCPATKAPPP